ncbi:MAG: methyl-accepting chemotaxis protein [Solirubrobacteraceae bacterium]|jgi:methyl-accepting chemotaxis protein|nr:methyl-accepting chemotaxis protein [Solirubrobacteraceae bacterium]
MNLLRNLSIAGKLLAGFGAVLALTVTLGAVMLVEVASVNAGGVRIGRNALPSVARIDRIALDASTNRYQLAQLMLEPASRAPVELALISASQTQVIASLRAYRTMVAPHTQDSALWHQVQSEWAAYLQVTAGAARLVGDTREAQAKQDMLIRTTASRFEHLKATIGRWSQVNADIASRQLAANASTYRVARALGIALLLASVLLGAGIALLVSRSIQRRVAVVLTTLKSLSENCIASIREGMVALAAGDLTRRYAAATPLIAETSGDEIGQIAHNVDEIRNRIVAALEAYNQTAASLTDTIGRVAQTAQDVGNSSSQMAAVSEQAGRATGEIAHAVGDVASGAERQVMMIDEARQSAQEVSRAVQEAVETARQTALVAAEASQVAQDGVEAAEEANRAMRSVRESSEAVSGAIGELAAKSGQIGQIVQTITGIAQQTNLLALNAAIEAARAGEQGRGFAVVADEVRKLAEDSQNAAQQISGLIGAIQSETSRAVSVVQDGTQRTHEGALVVDKTRDAFLKIGDAVADMTRRVEQIASVSVRIAGSAERMQDNMGQAAAVAEQSSASSEQVSAATQQTSASTQEIASSAHALSSNADALNVLVAGFTLRS